MNSYEFTKLLTDKYIQELFVLSGSIMLSIFMLFIIFKYSPLRYAIRRMTRLFLYEDLSLKEESIQFKMDEVDNLIKRFEKEFTDKILKDKESSISIAIDKYLKNNLANSISSKIEDTEILNSTVLGKLDQSVRDEVSKYLSNIELSEILKEKQELNKIERMAESNKLLERTIEQERNSSAILKTIMINLFVIFNIGILITYITWGNNISDHAIYAITGLYLSLATFIFYIFRTSHFRTGLLLALREDNKKHLDVIDYLQKRNDKDITEHDVDILRIFLTNRSEREQKSEHPYEVILKGISGSNVQFKGGKISLGKQKE